MDLNDRQIIAEIKNNPSLTRNNELETVLWKRYQRLIEKNWATLKAQMNYSNLILAEEDEYFSEAYVAFKKCINAINVNKIENDKWKFLGYYRLYLKNVRSNLIKKVILQAKMEKSLEYHTEEKDVSVIDYAVAHDSNLIINDDPADLLAQKEEAKIYLDAIEKCKANWTGTKRDVYNKKEEGKSNSEIARELGVHPSTITYYLKAIKKDVLKTINI